LKLTRDAWAGLAVLAASLFLFWLTLGLKDNPLVPIGPGYYPRIVLGVTAALALAVFVSGLFSAREPVSKEKKNYGLVAAMFAIFGLYCGALPYLGFRIATFAYVAATNALLDVPRGVKGWARVGLVALVTTFVVYYAFERYLSVLLPRGRWTGV
jgi:putative tricarboxylic transport membrane protein